MLNSSSMISKIASKITKKKKFYTVEEKISYIKTEYGLVHGKGKRKRKNNGKKKKRG